MRLSELTGKGQQQSRSFSPSSGGQQQQFDEIGRIRNAVPYSRPIEASYQGNPVTLLATGDIVGMSPSVQIVDEHGKLDWVSSDDVTIVQRELLPQSESLRTRLFQSSREPVGSNR